MFPALVWTAIDLEIGALVMNGGDITVFIYNDDCSSRSSCHGERTLSKTGEANPLVCFCGTYRGVLYVSHHRSTERGAVILIGIGPHHERLQPHTACTLNIKVVLVRTEVRRPSCRGLCVVARSEPTWVVFRAMLPVGSGAPRVFPIVS